MLRDQLMTCTLRKGVVGIRSPTASSCYAWLFLMGTTILSLLHCTISVYAFGPPRHNNHFRIITQRAAAASIDPSFLSSPASAPASSKPPFRLQRIDHIVIRCSNFPVMFDFYHRVLGCTIDEPAEEHVNRFGGALTHLRAGSCYIDLLAYDTNHLTEEGKEAAARMHAGGVGLDGKSVGDIALSSETSTLDHLCIRIDPFDREQIVNYLREENVEIIVVGDKRLGADGVGPSVYVRDPEGNVIELKGSPYQPSIHNNIDNTKKNEQKNDRGSHASNELQSSSSGVSEDTLQKTKSEDSKGAKSVNVPLTPCNRICRYNSSFYDGQVCIGCFREAYEIEMWQSMTPMQKSITLLDAIDRCSDSQQCDGDCDAIGENFDGAVAIDELTRQYEHWSGLAKEQ